MFEADVVNVRLGGEVADVENDNGRVDARVMSNLTIHVRARVELLTSAAGGRTQPIVGGASYRPNHNFFGPDNREMCMGFIELPAGQDLLPGQSAELEIDFWIWPELRGAIRPGRTWTIQEGPKVVGAGTILEVLSETSD